MSPYIQTTGVDFSNNELHKDNLEFSKSITSLLSQRLGDTPICLIYSAKTSRTRPHTEFNERPELSKVFSDNVNTLLDLLEENKGNTSKCLVPYFEHIQNSLINESISKSDFKLVFQDFNLNEVFEEKASNTLKDKLNSLMEKHKIE